MHLVFFFFLMWTIFKVFIEFVTILLPFYVLCFWPHALWDPSSTPRDRTHTCFTGRGNLSHWTGREVHALSFDVFFSVLQSGTITQPIFVFHEVDVFDQLQATC